jgi:hypothetical protein
MARCKYGKLKNPIGRRKCKRKPHLFGKGRKAARRRTGKCRYGKLKHRIGRRICRKKPFGKGRRVRSSIRAQEAAMWKAYRAGRL